MSIPAIKTYICSYCGVETATGYWVRWSSVKYVPDFRSMSGWGSVNRPLGIFCDKCYEEGEENNWAFYNGGSMGRITKRIKGNSTYFKQKYGTSNPEIEIEGTDLQVFGKSWGSMQGNFAAILYAVRSANENLGYSGRVFYGKVGNLGELVHEDELEDL